MDRRLTTIFTLVGLSVALGGCAGDREMQQEVLNLKSSSKKQFNLLKQQNEFMNRKVNTLNEKVEELTKANSVLSEQLATYANRPDEVKIEIISEVNTRFASIAKAQEDFRTQILADVKARQDEVDTRLTTEFDDVRKILNHHTAFVQFVAVEQDSINRVFASRMESRPWYQSIIGKWEDRERQQGLP